MDVDTSPEQLRVPRTHAPRIRTDPAYYLNLAHKAMEKGNVKKAIDYYILHAENLDSPNDMKLIEQVNLTKLTINLGSQITGNQTSSEIFGIANPHLAVLNLFPENALLLNTIGVLFFSSGEYAIARQFLERAAATGYLPGEKNYLHVIWNLIPRWHFRMLNDKNRNRAYRDAIMKAVRAGFSHVFDIGAGCGLLSLMAYGSTPDVIVTAFEEVKVLSDICKEMFKNYRVNYGSVYNKNSNMYTNLQNPCNLIVTEIFDASVFGEGCLRTIKHALQRFVTGSPFKIIPANVSLYVTGYESLELAKKHRYMGQLKELNLSACIIDNDPGVYEVEYLKNRNVKYITNTVNFLNVDFYDMEMLEDFLRISDKPRGDFSLSCTESGTIDGLAVWFDLNLDEEITISTHPSNLDNSCWEQAVFHIPHQLKVNSGDTVNVEHFMQDGQTSFKITSHWVECFECFFLSTDILTFLNDEKLVQGVIRAADTFEGDQSKLKVFDFNLFPLFGFLMAKKGATVHHVYHEESDLRFFSKVIEDNEIAPGNFVFIHEKTLEQYMVYLEAPDIVFTNLVRTDGSWNKEEFTLETENKLNCESIPKKILLNAQLINSAWLDTCNKVDDSNVLDFKIAQHINKLTGNEHPNLESFEYDPHSTVATFDISDTEIMDLHVEGDIVKDGSCNAILYWFDMQFTDDESNVFSTLESTHYDKCCTLLNVPKLVKKDDKLMFHMLRQECHLKVYCDQ